MSVIGQIHHAQANSESADNLYPVGTNSILCITTSPIASILLSNLSMHLSNNSSREHKQAVNLLTIYITWIQIQITEYCFLP